MCIPSTIYALLLDMRRPLFLFFGLRLVCLPILLALLIILLLLFLLHVAGFAVVGLLPVQVGKDEIEDVGVPACGAALDPLFDVL